MSELERASRRLDDQERERIAKEEALRASIEQERKMAEQAELRARDQAVKLLRPKLVHAQESFWQENVPPRLVRIFNETVKAVESREQAREQELLDSRIKSARFFKNLARLLGTERPRKVSVSSKVSFHYPIGHGRYKTGFDVNSDGSSPDLESKPSEWLKELLGLTRKRDLTPQSVCLKVLCDSSDFGELEIGATRNGIWWLAGVVRGDGDTLESDPSAGEVEKNDDGLDKLAEELVSIIKHRTYRVHHRYHSRYDDRGGW